MDESFIRSILIVKTSAIGDVIQTFPVLEYLRIRFPEAKIDWVAEQEIIPLLKAHPQLNDVISIASRQWRKFSFHQSAREGFKKLKNASYDLLFDLQGNTKSALVTGWTNAKIKVGFGWKSVREKSNLLVTHKRFSLPEGLNARLKYLGLVQKYFQDESPFVLQGVHLCLTPEEVIRLEKIQSHAAFSQGRQLMICFGSRWANKRLEPQTLISFLEKISIEDNPCFLFIYSNEEEKALAESFSSYFPLRSVVVGNLSLPLWQALMWKVDGVIAMDSAALHLCGTTLTPSFSIFGPSLAACYKPLEERHYALQGSCPYGKTFASRCPVLRSCTTGACIRQITSQELFLAYKKWSEAIINVCC